MYENSIEIQLYVLRAECLEGGAYTTIYNSGDILQTPLCHAY